MPGNLTLRAKFLLAVLCQVGIKELKTIEGVVRKKWRHWLTQNEANFLTGHDTSILVESEGNITYLEQNMQIQPSPKINRKQLLEKHAIIIVKPVYY